MAADMGDWQNTHTTLSYYVVVSILAVDVPCSDLVIRTLHVRCKVDVIRDSCVGGIHCSTRLHVDLTILEPYYSLPFGSANAMSYTLSVLIKYNYPAQCNFGCVF